MICSIGIADSSAQDTSVLTGWIWLQIEDYFLSKIDNVPIMEASPRGGGQSLLWIAG